MRLLSLALVPAIRPFTQSLPFALALLAACEGDLPRPQYVRQTTADLRPVGYPAPPARVEFIPEKPSSAAVWIDGEWKWSGSKWSWVLGRWVVPPAGARFAPWTTIRDDKGSVYFASGSWRDDAGQPLASPAPLSVARDTPGDVTSPNGDDEKTGPSQLPHASGTAPIQPPR